MNKPIAFGKYFLLERINVGGMAEVFKAKAFGVEGFERLVAVKRILPNIAEDEEFITMFIDEAKIAVQLQHANIAQIFDLGKVDDSYFIALEYVNGRDLRAIFDHLRKVGDKTNDKMPTSQACHIVMQVCEGLDYAHNKRDNQGRELNLVHRDVSPQNVLIGYEGEIKLVDFGIAKAAGKASKTQAGILKGKFGYMSPEQVRGLPVDRRSDIFALGIVLYELLTSERLFIGESDFSTLEKVRNVEILPPSSFNRKIPPELERIILKALAKDVEDRYQNAIDLHDDLQAFLYSVGEFFSRKDLAAWMKKTFVVELAEEDAKNAQYEQLEEPTPPPGPTQSPMQLSSGSSGRASGHKQAEALEWDEEELETQIFDKPAHEDIPAMGQRAGSSSAFAAAAYDRGSGGEAELSSADIFLSEDGEGDDKTVAGAPPPDILNDLGYGHMGAASPSGLSRPHGGGPPPGLSAYRQPSGTGYPSIVAAAVGAPGNSGAHPAVNGQARKPQSQFKQTLMGIPAAHLAGAPLPLPGGQSPPGGPSSSSNGAFAGGAGLPMARPTGTYAPISGVPERRPLDTMARRKGNRVVPVLLALVVMAVGGVATYKYLTRPGKLQIAVSPVDATVTIDELGLRGSPPFTIEKRPGTYTLAATRKGYLPKEQKLDVRAGESGVVSVQLEPSPDTGFSLTSDPAGAPVWLDGQPIIGIDGKQAVTNFRANPVPPGQHLLQIKGDPRFEDWNYPIYIEAGEITGLHAVLQPRRGGATPPPSEPKAPSPAPKPAAPQPEPPKPAAAPVAAQPASKPAPAAPAAQPASKPAAAAPVVAPPAEAPKPLETTATPAKPPGETPKPVATTPKPAKPRPAKPAAAASNDDVPEAPAAAAATKARCVITVGAKPWAEVWIDGKSTGKITPLVDFEVPCGKHKLTFKNKDLGVEKNESISLKAGEKFKRVFPLVDD